MFIREEKIAVKKKIFIPLHMCTFESPVFGTLITIYSQVYILYDLFKDLNTFLLYNILFLFSLTSTITEE